MKTPELIIAGWYGKESLGSAFWINFVLGQVAIGFALMIVFGPIVFFFSGLQPIVFVLSQAMYVAYLVWATVGVWRSASKSHSSSLLLLARSLSIGYTALLFAGCVLQVFDAT